MRLIFFIDLINYEQTLYEFFKDVQIIYETLGNNLGNIVSTFCLFIEFNPKLKLFELYLKLYNNL